MKEIPVVDRQISVGVPVELIDGNIDTILHVILLENVHNIPMETRRTSYECEIRFDLVLFSLPKNQRHVLFRVMSQREFV